MRTPRASEIDDRGASTMSVTAKVAARCVAGRRSIPPSARLRPSCRHADIGLTFASRALDWPGTWRQARHVRHQTRRFSYATRHGRPCGELRSRWIVTGAARLDSRATFVRGCPRTISKKEKAMSLNNDLEQRRLEARARRAAWRVGLLVRKSRKRSNVPNCDNFGEFMLVDRDRNYVVAGARFDLSAEEVLAYCAQVASQNWEGTSVTPAPS